MRRSTNNNKKNIKQTKIAQPNLFTNVVSDIKKNSNITVQYNEAEDDSKWESKVSVQMFTEFLGLVQSREFEKAIDLAGEILKIDPENQVIQQYLKVLDEHKTLAEQREAERSEEEEEDDDDEDEDEEDSDDDDEDKDYDSNNLSGADGRKKSHK